MTPVRRSLFVRFLTVALALCLVLVSLLFTGLTQGERLATGALRHLGAKYVLGQQGPERFDCSGLVLFCAEKEGITGLPRLAKDLYGMGRPVSASQLLPGDMLCFNTVRDSDPSDHVGFYLGGNQFVHASSSKRKVTVSDFDGYYLEKFTGARRLGCGYL